MGEGLINYNYLGSEECPIDPSADEIEYSMIFRIGRIEKLEECSNLRVRYFAVGNFLSVLDCAKI